VDASAEKLDTGVLHRKRLRAPAIFIEASHVRLLDSDYGNKAASKG